LKTSKILLYGAIIELQQAVERIEKKGTAGIEFRKLNHVNVPDHIISRRNSFSFSGDENEGVGGAKSSCRHLKIGAKSLKHFGRCY
jgi:hypothetical protein